MTLNDVMKLIDAGYTKADIEAFNQANEDPEPKADGDHQQKSDPIPEPAAAPDPVTNQNTEIQKLVAALGLKLDTLTGAVQAQNLNRAEGNTNIDTAGDIIAKIINPHYGEVKK